MTSGFRIRHHQVLQIMGRVMIIKDIQFMIKLSCFATGGVLCPEQMRHEGFGERAVQCSAVKKIMIEECTC